MLAPIRDMSKPWMAKDNHQAIEPAQEARDDPTKSVEWYQPTVKSLSESTVELFESYVGIRDEEAIKSHIYRIRDMAWKV